VAPPSSGDDDEKARRDLEKQLALLAERSTEQAEAASEHPRGALPALFRAVRAAPAELRAAAVAALALRLPDQPLVAPALELVRAEGLDGPFEAAIEAAAAEADAYASLRQAAALGRAGPGRLATLLEHLLRRDPPWDPTDLALELGVGPVCDAMREVLRLRQEAPARRRDRTSAALAGGALRALARMLPDDAGLHATLAQVIAAEARRAGKDEPTLALDALDALGAAPPFARLRLLAPLARAIERPKVRTRLEAALEAAAADAGVTPDERLDLTARTGGMDPDGRARVPLDEGDAFLAIGPRGEVTVTLEGPPGLRLAGPDARAVETATRELEAARQDLTRRLEVALVAGRRWSAAAWRAIFQGEHPLWSDLAPRLLWERVTRARTRDDHAGADDEVRCAFALGPQGPEDLFGEPVDLDVAGAAVALVHPVLLEPDERALWRERAVEGAERGERRLVAPFPQLFRPVALPLAPSEADPDPARTTLERFVGREAYKQGLGDVARRSGWTGFPLQGTPPWDLARVFPARPGETRAPVRAELTVEDAPVETKKVALPRRVLQSDDEDEAEQRRARREGRPPKRTGPPPEAAPRVKLARVALEGGAPAGEDHDLRVARAELVRDLELLTDGLATVDELFLRAWQHRKWEDEKAAWREVVLRYRQGSPALLAMRKELLTLLAAREGLTLRLEDRFAIAGVHVIELATGLVHHGAAKDHLPLWKVDETLGPGAQAPPPGLPFEPAADPDTLAVVARVLAFARAARG
jgi:hypothetical protein